MLHGGPGYPSYYLENLSRLSSEERSVVFYDQVDCGRSSGSIDFDTGIFGGFISQFEAVVEHLELTDLDLLGHSWGGFLALELYLRGRLSLQHLILASTGPSSAKFVEAAMQGLRSLPTDTRKKLEELDAAGDYDNPEYKRASDLFEAMFVDRLDPLPDGIAESNKHKNAEIYQKLWGPSEFRCLGTLATNWNVSDELAKVTVPTLITSGAYDEAGPLIQQHMLQRLPSARWKCFQESAHHAHLSEEERYLAVVSAFLEE